MHLSTQSKGHVSEPGNKFNLNDTTHKDSIDIETNSEAKTVAVMWEIQNQSCGIPALRNSRANGRKFRPVLILATCGNIRSSGVNLL
jgi:hypothetical protein